MSLSSVPFLLALAATSLLFTFQVNLRKVFFTAVNLLFLYQLVPNETSGIVFILFLLGSYGLLQLNRLHHPLASPWLWIALLTGGFLVLKKYTFFNHLGLHTWIDHSIVIAGISYMLFKLVHMLVDVRQGEIKEFNFFSYINYQISFFTIMAGPIQRFGEFDAFWSSINQARVTRQQALHAWNRVLSGVIKMGVLATLTYGFYNEAYDLICFNQVEGSYLAQVLIYFYGYPVYIYLNFSGYCDIVIGAAALFGLKLPENFNSPILSRNMNDFWNRWHITLSKFIRDYFFMHTYKRLAEKNMKVARFLSHPLLFVSLVLMGIWHGPSMNYLLFGIIHAFGVVVTQVYGDYLKNKFGRKWLKQYMNSLAVRVIAIVITFHYVCFSFLFFPRGVNAAIGVLQTIAEHFS